MFLTPRIHSDASLSSFCAILSIFFHCSIHSSNYRCNFKRSLHFSLCACRSVSESETLLPLEEWSNLQSQHHCKTLIKNAKYIPISREIWKLNSKLRGECFAPQSVTVSDSITVSQPHPVLHSRQKQTALVALTFQKPKGEVGCEALSFSLFGH